MATDKNKTYFCEKCGRTLSGDNFYTSNNLEKYPNDGKLNQCKKCITMHVDNWDPETYLWILKEIDVPYIPEEWNKTLASYANNNKKITGMTVLGRYLSKMKMVQFNKWRWADTEYLQELASKRVEETMKRQGYSMSQIDEVIKKGIYTVPEKIEQPEYEDKLPSAFFEAPSRPVDQQPVDDYFARMSGADQDDDLSKELTDEDKKYLRLKWGKAYKAEEWIALEQLYNDMMESYDIQSAGHIDILKKCCKTSLKADQLLDIGDVEGAQKMVKMYDMLMKSGKFTAVQNKGDSGEVVDSLAELFALCEEDGFIPRYYVDEPKDKVDRTLQDLQSYAKTLIEEETNLSSLIESAMRQIEKDKEQEAESSDEAEAANDDDLLEQELFAEDKPLTDNDFNKFFDWEDEEQEEASELYKKLENGEL